MKETELQNTSETSKTEVQNLSAHDKRNGCFCCLVMFPCFILRAAHALPDQVVEMFNKDFAENDIWQHFDAVKNGRVYDLTYEYFGMSATFKYPQALEELQPILYPESDEDTQKAKEASDNAQKKAKDSDATEKYNEQQSK